MLDGINQCTDMPLVTCLNGRLGWTSSESLHNSVTVYQRTYIYITCWYVVQIYEATGGCDGAWLSYSTCNHVHQYIKISGCYTPHDEPTAPIGRPVRMFSHTTYLARLSVADMHPLPVLATTPGSLTLDFRVFPVSIRCDDQVDTATMNDTGKVRLFPLLSSA